MDLVLSTPELYIEYLQILDLPKFAVVCKLYHEKVAGIRRWLPIRYRNDHEGLLALANAQSWVSDSATINRDKFKSMCSERLVVENKKSCFGHRFQLIRFLQEVILIRCEHASMNKGWGVVVNDLSRDRVFDYDGAYFILTPAGANV